EDLSIADEGSFFTILGTGGEASEWVSGVEDLLSQKGIGRPVEWFSTTGAEVNLYATEQKGRLNPDDKFRGDLGILMFPNTGLHVGRLAVFRISFGASWFDDMIQNMRRA